MLAAPWMRYAQVGFAFALLAIVAMLAVGCRRGAVEPATLRIVSLSPSTTEAAFAIGAGAFMVGRSHFCDHPPEAKALPDVGGYVDPNFEVILSLRPSLVVGARGPLGASVVDRFTSRGISVFFPETETFTQIEDMILGLGERTRRTDAARDLVLGIRSAVHDIERRVSSHPRVRALLVFGFEPIVVAGPGGFADEMIARAGGVNVVTEGSHYPTLGLERVLSLEPDAIVNLAMGEAHGESRISKDAAGWQKLRAVREGKVHRVADETLLRPGPRVAQGLEKLARTLHPEAF